MKNILVKSNGVLYFNEKEYSCALGKGGVRAEKREGDGATPIGCFCIREIFYRPDKFCAPPDSAFPTKALTEYDGWCDDVNTPEYNTHIKLPYDGSHEELWRGDHLYDIIVVLGYNDGPPIVGNGSAIFMHLARDGYTPTAGCIALSKEDLVDILKNTDATTQVCIEE